MDKKVSTFVLISLYSILDYFITKIVLDKVGLDQEVNPITQFLIDKHGIESILAFKLLSLFALFLIFKKMDIKMLYILSIIVVLVVVWGTWVLYQII